MSLGSDHLDNIIDLYKLNDPWDAVELFEKKISVYCGSKFAISTDCCTHSIFLCLKYLEAYQTLIEIPSNTYISLPSVIKLANYNFSFVENKWHDYYYLKPLNIIDSATCLKKNMFVKDTMMCLSFHHRKTLPIGRGGMILTDSEDQYQGFVKKRYDGRNMKLGYKVDEFSMSGYHMYMTPEQAAYGIYLFDNEKFNTIQNPNYSGYKPLDSYKSIF